MLTLVRRAMLMYRPSMVVLATLFGATYLGIGTAHSDPLPATPSTDQLTNQISVIFDANASDAQRASYLEAGSAAIPAANAVAGLIGQYRSMVSLRVENPALDGDRLTSQLAMSMMGMGSQTRPLAWVLQDGEWKLTSGSMCEIVQEVTNVNTCPL